jgi:hypothetical protein
MASHHGNIHAPPKRPNNSLEAPEARGLITWSEQLYIKCSQQEHLGNNAIAVWCVPLDTWCLQHQKGNVTSCHAVTTSNFRWKIEWRAVCLKATSDDQQRKKTRRFHFLFVILFHYQTLIACTITVTVSVPPSFNCREKLACGDCGIDPQPMQIQLQRGSIVSPSAVAAVAHLLERHSCRSSLTRARSSPTRAP